MANVVFMPKAGQSMEEGKILKWFKKVGDKIEKGDVLLEVETDKAALEVESMFAGTLKEIIAQEGETLPVLAAIGIIAKDGEAYNRDELIASAGGEAAPKKEETPKTAEAPKAAAPVARSEVRAASVMAAPATSGRIFASPAARRIAREKGIDLGAIKGSGPGGRIKQTDVVAQAGSASAQPSFQPATPVITGEAIPLSRMRQAIARALQSSKVNAPHFYVTVDIDMTAAMAHRSRINATTAAEGQSKVSVNDMVIRACALGLESYPALNCHTDGKSVTYKDDINIGVAVNLTDGLVVPVLMNANRKPLYDIARETKQLALNAQQGRLIGMGQGTFTISNMGMLGVKSFTAIINPPEAGILAVGAVQDRVVAIKDAIGIRKIMEVTLSADHRVVDGALAAQFLGKIKSLLENPESLG